MEECGSGGGDLEQQRRQESEETRASTEEPGSEQGADESERGRPSTPKWWRPPVPPETYKWEEVRRQREKGGYPWTHLDKDEEIDVDDYLDDNLYEPVNPPPLYGNDSYLSKDLQQVPQTEERMIDIPAEIEAQLLTSEGLDGLDKPDPHDLGFDGDREWQNVPSEDEQAGGRQSRSSLAAGNRGKAGESRSTTPKSVGFSPETITHETPADDELEEQEVPGDAEAGEPSRGREGSSSRGRRSRSSSPGKKQTPFDILKAKAADAADQMKQRFRAAIPVRPKFTKSSRKKRKTKHGQEEAGEQEVPEDVEMKDEAAMEEGVAAEEKTTEESPTDDVVTTEEAKEIMEEEEIEEETTGDDDKLSKKEEKEKKKAEEKAAKLKAAEEAKQAKIEEKLAKAKEAEDKRQAKAEEDKRKQEEKEEAARKAAEEKKAEEERKAAEKAAEEERKAAEKAAKEEEARIAAEKKKAEEEARKAAEKAKKEEEARIAAEKKKAEEERKAAEKAKKDEEARIAAEKKKAEDERKAAEKAKKEEEAKARKTAEVQARKEAAAKKAAEEEAKKEAAALKAAEEEAIRKAVEEEASLKAAVTKEEGTGGEESQPMDTSEVAPDAEAEAPPAVAEGGEGDGEEMDTAEPQPTSGITKRKYIRQRRGPTALSQLPNPIATLRNQVEDFKNKLKRSRTPPRRQVQRKHRRSRSADASKSPPRDPDEVSQKTEEGEEGVERDAAVEEEQQQKSTDEKEESATSPQPEDPETKSESAVPVGEEGEGEAQTEEQAPAPFTGGTGTTERKKRLRQHPAKEKLDNIGASLKGLGAKTFGVASMATKEVGQTLKAVGKLGSKAVKSSSKSKVKASQQQEADVTAEGNVDAVSASVSMEAATEPPAPPEGGEEGGVVPPKRTFRFKRRGESQDEEDEDEHFYENANEMVQDRHVRNHDPFERNALLGSGARDWESPQDRARDSRGVSEERVSGKISSRDSPPGSSLASSTVGGHVRRTGVLEEIDSDEFFLRERGISEGEDEEEVNRFLVEELRQAFRPSLSNALTGFDMDPPLVPPSRPGRAPRKPPRKDKAAEEPSTTTPSTYQTFPPERPKRKQPQGYVSKFMKEHPEEEEEEGEYSGSNEEVRGSEMGESLGEDGEETLQQVKDKLSELDRELDDAEATATDVEPAPEERFEESPMPPTKMHDEYEDDGRYEPISDGPTKPTRTKRGKPKRPPTPPSFYYNTIAANEWLRELEETTAASDLPAAPVRKRRGSGKSSSLPPASDDEQQRVAPYEHTTRTSSRAGAAGGSGTDEYVDEAGYAIVQKDRADSLPKTIPRKKKKRTNLQQSSSQQQNDATFFSLPRPEPPTRPNRTYSTLRPRRPPRSKSGSRSNLEEISTTTTSPSKSPVPGVRRGEGEDGQPRPSTAIGIMQGRPLPPPPRPLRSPQPQLGELDQSSIEMAVGLRHYANFEDMESRPLEETFPPRVVEVDIACQTDPVPDDEFIVGLPSESSIEDSGRIRAASSRLDGQEAQDTQGLVTTSTTTGDVSSSSSKTHQTSSNPPAHSTDSSLPLPPSYHNPSPSPSPTPFTLPTRLHLEELEVDFLKVNELIAQSIKVENLMQTSQLEVNSLNATGVSRLQTQSLNSEQVNCSRLLSSDMSSSSPQHQIPSSQQFSSYDDDDPKKALSRGPTTGSEQELCLKAEEQGEKENESACTPDIFDDCVNNLVMMADVENVDFTNHIKCSHVAEKVVDKQLNLPDSETSPPEPPPEDDYSKVDRQSSPVVANIPSTTESPILTSAPPPPPTTNTETQQVLNDLNQAPSSPRILPSEPAKIEDPPIPPRRQVSSTPPRPPTPINTQEIEVEEDEEQAENVVCGSYTLPYSYMPASGSSSQKSQSPSLSRKGSMKKNQQQAPKTPPSPSPRRSSSDHVAFGHTSVAQGEVLSVKLSIPVERAAIGPSLSPSTPPAGVRAPPRYHHGPSNIPSPSSSSSAQLPESATSQADSSKRDAQQQKKQASPSPPASISLAPSPPPTLPSANLGDSAAEEDSEESFFSTSVRIARALMRFTMRALQAMADYIDTAASEDPAKAEQQRANMQVLLCLLLVLLVGLILATARSSPYSSPRWEFLMPPPDL